jgi:hypothetical protein
VEGFVALDAASRAAATISLVEQAQSFRPVVTNAFCAESGGTDMLGKLVYIALVIGVVAGFAGMFSVHLWPTARRFDELSEPDRSIRKQKRFAGSLHTFSISAGGLILLIGQFASALEVLLGVIFIRGLLEIGVRNWKPKALGRAPSLAFDATTGSVLGEIVTETRNWSTGAIEAFTIRTATGELIERSAENIRVQSYLAK